MIDWIPERTPDLLSTMTEDGTVIVSPDDGRLSVLNEVGAFIWEMIDGQRSIEAIVQGVVDTFDVSSAQARQDVQTFMAALTERQLVTRKEQT